MSDINLTLGIDQADFKKAEKQLNDLLDADFDFSDIDKALSQLDFAIDDVELNIDTTSIDSAESKLKALDQKIDIEADSANAKGEIDSIDSRLNSLQDTDIKIDADGSGAEQAIEQIEKKLDELKSGGSLFESLAGGFAGGLGAGAIIGGLDSIVGSAGNTQKALLQLQATTGLTREESEKLNNTAKELFAGGVGENIDEVRQSLGTARKEFSAFLEPAEIDTFVKSAGGIAQVFDKDINEVVQLSRTFVQNFGLEGKEAGDLIALTLRDAGNQADDVLDTLSEYSPLVKEAGFSAQEFTGILTAGIQAGARDTDKLADAIKESGLIIREGAFGDAFAGLSEKANEAERATINSVNAILQSAQKGDISIAEALTLSTQEVNEAVNAEEISTGFAQQLQKAFAGTQAEDIGIEFFNKAFSAPIDPKNIQERGAEATEAIEEAIQPQGFEGLQRTLTLLIGDISNALLPALQPVLDILQQDLLPLISSIFGNIRPILTDLANALSPLIKELSGALLPVIESTFNIVQPLLGIVIDLVKTALDPLLSVLKPILNALSPILDVVGQLVSAFAPLIGIIAKVAVTIINLALQFNPLLIVLEALTPLIEQFANFLEKTVVPVIEKFAGSVVETVDKIASWLGLTKETEKAQKDLVKQQEKSNTAIKDGTETLEERNKRLEDAKNGIKTTTVLTKEETKALAKNTKAKKDNVNAIDALNNKIKELNTNLELSVFEGNTQDAIRYRQELNLAEKQLQKFKTELEILSKIDFNLDSSLQEIDGVELGSKTGKEFNEAFRDSLTNEVIPAPKIEPIDDSEITEIGLGDTLGVLYDKIAEFEEVSNALANIGVKDAKLLGDAFKESFNVINFLTDNAEQGFNKYAESVSNAVGLLSQSLEEGTALQKAAAITEATINSYLAFTQVLADPTIQPSFLKPVFAGVILAQGISQISKIVGAETGVIGIDENYKGKVGKTDTIPVLMAKKESIISAEGTKNNIEALTLANKGINVAEHYKAQSKVDMSETNDILKNVDRHIRNQRIYLVNNSKSNLKNAVFR